MSAHAHAAPTSEEKVRLYFKVFFALFIITILEVSATRLPGARIIRNVIIALLACTKAGAVGYFYMHLNHETKWLKIVALLPMIMLVYSAVLIPDTAHNRPTSVYLPVRPRIFPPSEEEGHEEAKTEGAEASAAPEAPEAAAKEVSASSGQEAPAAAAAAPSAPSTPPAGAAPAPGAGAAASDSANDWK